MHRDVSEGGRFCFRIRMDNADEEGLLSDSKRRSSGDGAPIVKFALNRLICGFEDELVWDLCLFDMPVYGRVHRGL